MREKINNFIKEPKKYLKFIIPVAILVFAIIIIFSLNSKTINLNKYITVNATGYETIGKATYTFDSEKFIKDYDGKLKAKNVSGEEANILNLFYGSGAKYLAADLIDGAFDKESGLSNGDKVTFKWSCKDSDVKKYFGYKLKYSDISYTVSGLEKANIFDPFENVSVVFSGVGPNATATVKNNSTNSPASKVSFKLSKANGLSNGDKVTVKMSDTDSASTSSSEYFVNKYGAIPSATEKEYTVEGLSTYVTSTDDIPSSLLDKMKTQAEDKIKSSVASDLSKDIKLNSSTYIGCYCLVLKATSALNDQNMVYMAFKTNVTINSTEKGVNDTFDYYTVVKFTNVMKMNDGKGSVDLTAGSIPYDTFSKKYPGGWFGNSYTLKGYENIETMFNRNVTTQIDRYSYTTTVKE